MFGVICLFDLYLGLLVCVVGFAWVVCFVLLTLGLSFLGCFDFSLCFV